MSKKQTFEVKKILQQFKKFVNNNQIHFLKNGPNKNLENPLDELINQFEKGKDGEAYDWHEAHKAGRKLWQVLLSRALNSIDRNSKGNLELFNFLEDATRFEDLLYGLEPYYRDHTLHSLWVYFLGVNLFWTDLEYIYKQPNWYVFNDIKKDNKKYHFNPILEEYSKIKKEMLCIEANRHKDAIWCIIALCHDLGYSLAKLKNLNERVQKVLAYFDVSDFKHLGYSLNIEHQYHMAQFLDLMAMDIRIVPGEDYSTLKDKDLEKWEDAHDMWKNAEKSKDDIEKYDNLIKDFSEMKVIQTLEDYVLVKCYRDDSTYWRLSRALEKKEHGILSAYLIYKVLGFFAESSIRGPAEEWGLDKTEAQKNIIRGDILFAVAQHEFDFAHLNQLSSFGDILIIVDELEEFSRFGRQLLSRKYSPTTAKSSIKFLNNIDGEKIKQGEKIDIEIDYKCQHKKREDFLKFLARKAERLCSIYSLNPYPEEEEEEKEMENYCIIKSIKITFSWEEKGKPEEKYWFHFAKDAEPEGELPECQQKPQKWGYLLKTGKYKLSSYDDELKVKVTKKTKTKLESKEIPLKKWVTKLEYSNY